MERPACIFYQRGQCRNGSSCHFSHSGGTGANAGKETRDCTFFLQGNCRFGTGCALLHPSGSTASARKADGGGGGGGRTGHGGSSPRQHHHKEPNNSNNNNKAALLSLSHLDPHAGYASAPMAVPAMNGGFDSYDDFDPTLPPSHSDFMLATPMPSSMAPGGHFDQASNWRNDYDADDLLPQPANADRPLVMPTASGSTAFPDPLDGFDALTLQSDFYQSDDSETSKDVSGSPTDATPQMVPQQLAYTPYSVIAKSNAAALSPKKPGYPGSSPKASVAIRSEVPSSSSTDGRAFAPDDDALCPFAYNGLCRFGNKCRYTHGLKCPRCQKFCLHPRNMELRDKHLEECANSDILVRAYDGGGGGVEVTGVVNAAGGGERGGAGSIGSGVAGGGLSGNVSGTCGIAGASGSNAVMPLSGMGMAVAGISASARMSNEMDCVVCFERVLRKADPRFGLLSCEHCVCLECVRQWRRNEGMDNAKACPICRQITHIIIPSSIWITEPHEKEYALEAYKKRMNKIDCKHYNYGEGTCPFGTSCLYRHVRRDGTVDEGRIRFVVGGQEGDQTRVIGAVQLFDFFQ
ncbi:hypothetical protein BC830DRAFT_1090275 [Chytriomyces sp. MP71]|nr:hypothetical protein BC830DRAFT_1090275 [Chytriomyces sp. MP71]